MTISAPTAEGAGASEAMPEADPLRVASWPNAVTGLRILMVPVLVGSFFIAGASGLWLGFAVFAAAAFSDFLDGWLARRLDQHSLLGRILDPIADKLLVAAALVMLATDGRAPVIAVVAILLREFLISGLREALAGKVALPVQPLAKWKTAAQMSAIALLLLTPAIAPWLTEATGTGLAHAGEGLLWLAVVLTWASAIGYLRASVRGLRAARPKQED
ncbi:MAG: CDP-diacylglycerol--glycerol-3-phosphate 3-phosphatidyltransferase [Rhodospirillales bacterium]|nr:CDP-diacylglycerol--glycerol-3-phosphate 3-phosphatidyltransferase [Rhodospirillales bacterium]